MILNSLKLSRITYYYISFIIGTNSRVSPSTIHNDLLETKKKHRQIDLYIYLDIYL